MSINSCAIFINCSEGAPIIRLSPLMCIIHLLMQAQVSNRVEDHRRSLVALCNLMRHRQSRESLRER
eukprot:COSAG01_NODE_51490_length_354_cov_1.050980_1_plen_66_part_10